MTTTKEDLVRWFESGDMVLAADSEGTKRGRIESIDYDGDCYVGGRLFFAEEVIMISSSRLVARAIEIEAQLERLVDGISSGEADEGGIDEARAILREFKLLLEDISQFG